MPFKTPDERRQYGRNWWAKASSERRAEINAYKKAWAERNKERVTAQNRAKRLANIEAFRERERQNYHRVKEGIRARARAKYNSKSPAAKRNAIKTKAWRARNKELVLLYRRKHMANPKYRLAIRMRSRLRSALNAQSARKSSQTLALLGCSIEDFKIYMESKFDVGMTWENWGKGNGKWHIDHIMPCAIFDLTRPEHQKRCFHFSNLQPLWQRENLRKHTTVKSNQFNLL